MNQKQNEPLSAWDADREKEFRGIVSRSGISNALAARVIGEQGREFWLRQDLKEGSGILTGSLRYGALSSLDIPVAGDWVLITQLDENEFLIHQILPRRSLLVRKSKGEIQRPDPIAANMDRIFLLQGLDGDFQPRRLERTLVQLWESGASPCIILTKSDLYSENQLELDEKIRLVRESCPGVPVHAISTFNGEGLQELLPYWEEDGVFAFIGSSGVGKSSLLNSLLGKEIRSVQEVRVSDSKGKHTTTNRWMFELRSGLWILDTPGMREIQLWSDGSGLEETFPEIFESAGLCKFQDCSHSSEPGCAVQEALEEGKISYERFRSFQKLQREMQRIVNLSNPNSSQQLAEKAKWKSIHKEQKRMKKQRDRERYR
ncbi:ribosome small subunit-dependent GTPase A [Leptospira langatensis]|uniref:Small ribosomal subunit biogenesis GTPase RsgA n=1 Tax=Leptospira langatensis TaxID=2484983 RepID=A0A5F1ZUU6_9LEPT|nr:ribosome small subunit-dependent GTPase A [Leptospira langatensis]TGK01344.1 ribosome small subunit-dependent GTPase A [Leptospira langatensis]TGL42204.1 ribosome small subunit-dependent GTPase A [Leptospira langatensis]